MYQQVDTFTEDELLILRNSVEETLLTMRRKLAKKKFRIFGKTLLSVVLVAGGVAVAVVFPSPITVAVLGGAAALISGRSGLVRDVKGVKEGNAKRRNGKQELKSLEGELVGRKTARDVMITISYQQQPTAQPTAPPLYPGLEF